MLAARERRWPMRLALGQGYSGATLSPDVDRVLEA